MVVFGVLMMLLFKENYPFSHFPMYSRNSEKTYLVYVTDESDEPVLFRLQFGRSIIRVKKVYDKARQRAEKDPKFEGMAQEEVEKVLGESTLRQIVAEREPRVPEGDVKQYQVLKLWKTNLFLRKSGVEEETYLLAEIDVDDEG